MVSGLQGEVRVGGRRFAIRVNLDMTYTILEWVRAGELVGEWRMLPLTHRLHPYKSDWSAYLAAIIAVERHVTSYN